MNKKILFMLINLNIGGTEKALLNMISEMPKDKFDITLLLLDNSGGFYESVPKGVNVQSLNGYSDIKDVLNKPPRLIALDFFKRGKIIKAFNLLLFYSLSKLLNDSRLFLRYVLMKFPSLEDEYDLAVAYAGPMEFISYFVSYKIHAKQKAQWIHFDVSKINFNIKFATKVYKNFDQIFVVSKEGLKKFIDKIPNLSSKTTLFSNIVSSEYIKRLAEQGDGFTDFYNGIRILTVGRLSHEKGQDLSIRVLAKLKESGYKVRWYAIGEGDYKKEYEKMIQELDLYDDFILLGATPNPYPFMKLCDFYVQSSRHEGFCITLSEARCFNNPVITTNFTGASEQIKHGETGIIVDFHEDELFNALVYLLNNEKEKNRIKSNLLSENIDSRKEIEKLNSLVESL